MSSQFTIHSVSSLHCRWRQVSSPLTNPTTLHSASLSSSSLKQHSLIYLKKNRYRWCYQWLRRHLASHSWKLAMYLDLPVTTTRAQVIVCQHKVYRPSRLATFIRNDVDVNKLRLISFPFGFVNCLLDNNLTISICLKISFECAINNRQEIPSIGRPKIRIMYNYR